jgi:hypothetical protein
MTEYRQTIEAIKTVCANINLTYSAEGDGRITSAVKETEYLDALERGLQAHVADSEFAPFQIGRPKDRFWYDIKINEIPINLKLTMGGTDNAFNKIAILFTISGEENLKKNMNYNTWFSLIQKCRKKEVRDHATEYHYLVVDKHSGQVLLKSILDIHTYKTNPCNILQINWAHEFRQAEYAISDADFKGKMGVLLKTIQTSIRQAIAGMDEFAGADIDAEFVSPPLLCGLK